MKGAIYYVAIAKVIFSHVKITCYFHMWRYQVFARKLTWYFIGVYIIIIIVNYFLQLFRDFDYRPLYRGWPLNGGSTVEQSPEQSHGAFCHQTDPNSRRSLKGNRDLTKLRRRRQRQRQNAIRLMTKTTTLHVHHAFLYISLQSLQNCTVKWQNFELTWETGTARR